MSCKRLQNLSCIVITNGPTISARGFSNGLGTTQPSTPTKLAYLLLPSHSFAAQLGELLHVCFQAYFVSSLSAKHAPTFYVGMCVVSMLQPGETLLEMSSLQQGDNCMPIRD
jgi:hypothetical protein